MHKQSREKKREKKINKRLLCFFFLNGTVSQQQLVPPSISIFSLYCGALLLSCSFNNFSDRAALEDCGSYITDSRWTVYLSPEFIIHTTTDNHRRFFILRLLLVIRFNDSLIFKKKRREESKRDERLFRIYLCIYITLVNQMFFFLFSLACCCCVFCGVVHIKTRDMFM